VTKAECSCPVGFSEACGHITGLLYQIAKYKALNLRTLPEDVAKTSQPQTWHTTREEKIRGKEGKEMGVSGYRKYDGDSETAPRTVRSTLYNPISGVSLTSLLTHRQICLYCHLFKMLMCHK
jgi:hypothetical protein